MIQQTFDVDFIRRIVTDPTVWPYAVDEGQDPAIWQPSFENCAWLHEPGLDAVALVYCVSGLIYAYDAAVLASARATVVGYSERRSYIERIIWWLKQNTHCIHLCAFIAEDNPRSVRAAIADGLKLEGRIPKGKRRGNGFVDALIYGIEV